MRAPWIAEGAALRERMVNPAQAALAVSAGPQAGQADPAEPEPAALPEYVSAFLAHLRLLVGIPFEYLVPDLALLPDESIRFFHLDRSWTDRVVDGVLAVGKVGTREQAHHHAAAPSIDATLDALEPTVRPVQRGLAPLTPAQPEAAVSGFVLRSALVAGWPHMDVRAYRASVKLTLLRLERLSSSVLIALFAGVPDRVELEEPHHGVQFGVTGATVAAPASIDPRGADGIRRPGAAAFPVGFRLTDPSLRVVQLADLRRIVSYRADLDDPGIPSQTGSAALAIELLRPPWKQVFSDEGPSGGPGMVEVTS